MKTLMRTILLAALLSAGTPDAAERNPLFRDHAPLKAVLSAPIAQAYAQRQSDVSLYFPGQWAYIDDHGVKQRLQVSIRLRGNFRRDYCELPPLRLNFKKSEVKGTLFAGQDKLKLVAPCQHGIESQQNLLLEYLAYRMLEVLTDRSFGVRLLRLSYVDTDEKLKSWTDMAFVIEDQKDIGDRLGLDRARVAENRFHELDQPTTALVEMFQYMIANHDYSVLKGPPGEYCCHNTVMYVEEARADKRIPIPYDFDMSGLVSADYASPPAHLPIRLVRTRFYRGLCQPDDVMEATIAHFLDKKDEIFALFDAIPELSRLSRNRNVNYIRKFYAILEDPVMLKELVLDRCRGRDLLEEMMNPEPAEPE